MCIHLFVFVYLYICVCVYVYMYICISVFDLVEYLAVSSEQGPIASGQMCIGHQHPNLNISFTNYCRELNFVKICWEKIQGENLPESDIL